MRAGVMFSMCRFGQHARGARTQMAAAQYGASVGTVSSRVMALVTSRRTLSVRTEDFFSKEGISHARRVSWAPHTTEKKQGVFAKLARSNFSDPLPESFSNEPYFEEEIEAYRAHHRPDVYIYNGNANSGGQAGRADEGGAGSAVQVDDLDAWAEQYISASVQNGRQSPAAAAYFRNVLQREPDARKHLLAIRERLGGQNARQLTRFQQAQMAEEVLVKTAGEASGRLRRARDAVTAEQRYAQDGTPTGEAYWYEAESTLTATQIPPFVKDEVFDAMRQQRPADSPANAKPTPHVEAGRDESNVHTQ